MAESNGHYETARVILYAVVSQNGLALKFASEKLKGDPEIMSEALSKMVSHLNMLQTCLN